MKPSTYHLGIPGFKWGVWNLKTKQFAFGICEDTPMLAEARLFQKVGDDARKWRYELRKIPDRKKNGQGEHYQSAKWRRV